MIFEMDTNWYALSTNLLCLVWGPGNSFSEDTDFEVLHCQCDRFGGNHGRTALNNSVMSKNLLNLTQSVYVESCLRPRCAQPDIPSDFWISFANMKEQLRLTEHSQADMSIRTISHLP
jgi:hypothetical protein